MGKDGKVFHFIHYFIHIILAFLVEKTGEDYTEKELRKIFEVSAWLARSSYVKLL